MTGAFFCLTSAARKAGITLFLLVAVNSLWAQNIFQDLGATHDSARVTVSQDERVEKLFEAYVAQNEAKNGKIPGYRILIFSDYREDARTRGLQIRSGFLSQFPDFDVARVYTEYEAPFVKIRVGDYRDENAALIDYMRFVEHYPDCYIVKSTINYPKLAQ